MAEEFPVHVACAWIGNSKPVAFEHYLQITDDHFQQATQQGTEAAQNAAQYTAELGRDERETQQGEPILAGQYVGLPDYSTPQMGDDGLEPPTSTL